MNKTYKNSKTDFEKDMKAFKDYEIIDEENDEDQDDLDHQINTKNLNQNDHEFNKIPQNANRSKEHNDSS